MSGLSQQFVDVKGPTLEILSSTGYEPVICTAHPLFAEPVEGGILSNLLVGSSRVVVVNPRDRHPSLACSMVEDPSLREICQR